MSSYTRREFLRRGAGTGVLIIASGGVLAACQAATSASPTAAGTTSPIAAGTTGTSTGTPAASSGGETTWQRIQRTKSVKVGFSNEPPYDFVGTDGTLTGQSPEVLRRCMQAYGVTSLEPVQVDFSGLIPGLVSRRFDVVSAGTAVTPARCQQVDFGDIDAVIVEAAVVKAGNPKNIHSFKDFVTNTSLKVGFETGNADIQIGKDAGVSAGSMVILTDGPSALAALRAGRIDAFVNNNLTIGALLQKDGKTDIEVATPFTGPLDPTGNEIKYYTANAFNKGDPDFLAAYNVELVKITANGELAKILAPFGFGASAVPKPGLSVPDLCAGKALT